MPGILQRLMERAGKGSIEYEHLAWFGRLGKVRQDRQPFIENLNAAVCIEVKSKWFDIILRSLHCSYSTQERYL